MIRSPAGFDGGDRIKRYLDYYQPSYGVMMLSAGQFSPALLFAAGEQGAWYDPSDFSTMFQDSAGTTPVTAVEQPVGKILDKSGRGNHASQSTSGSQPVLSARVNRLTYSEDFSNAVWTKVGVTASGARLTAIAGTSAAYAEVAVFNAPATTITISAVFASTVGRNRYAWVADRGVAPIASATFDLNAVSVVGKETSVTANAMTLSDGSVRCTVTYTRASVGTSGPQFALAGSTYTSDRPVITWSGGEFLDAKIDFRVTNDGVGLPTYQRVGAATDYDTSGFPFYLKFDGVNDSLATSTITPGVDKAQVFSGVRKLSDSAQAIVAELSATIAANAGSFALTAPNSAAANYNFSSKGTTQTDNTVTTYTSPLTTVLSGIGDIAGASNLIRANGTQVGSVLTTQGTGNYLAYPLYIGRRGGTSNPFNGQVYSMIVRFGANLSDAQIASTETWVNGKTKAY